MSVVPDPLCSTASILEIPTSPNLGTRSKGTWLKASKRRHVGVVPVVWAPHVGSGDIVGWFSGQTKQTYLVRAMPSPGIDVPFKKTLMSCQSGSLGTELLAKGLLFPTELPAQSQETTLFDFPNAHCGEVAADV